MRIYAHRLAWALHHGSWPEHQIDHIDGNPDNNAIANLRAATVAQNLWNRSAYKRGRSGFKGVSRCKRSGLWRANINVNGRYISLGRHRTAKDAARAYLEAALRYHGEFAKV